MDETIDIEVVYRYIMKRNVKPYWVYDIYTIKNENTNIQFF